MGKHSKPDKNKPIKAFSIIVIISVLGLGLYIFYNNKNINIINEPKNETQYAFYEEKETVEIDEIDEEKEAEIIINNALNALKESNIDEVNQYLDYNELINKLDSIILEVNNSNIEENMFKDISWSIKEVEIIDNKTTVKIELSNKNYKKILTNFSKEIINEKNNNIEIDNEKMIKILNDKLENEDEYITTTNNILLIEDDNEWKIEINDELIDLLYPGLNGFKEVLK